MDFNRNEVGELLDGDSNNININDQKESKVDINMDLDIDENASMNSCINDSNLLDNKLEH